MTILTGKQVLVTGVARADSIALAVAGQAQQMGAEVALAVFPRDLDGATEAARRLTRPPVCIVAADVTAAECLASLELTLHRELGHIDAVLHAIAFAPPAALDSVLDADSTAVELAFRTSTHSYASLARVLANLAPAGGGSLVGLDFDSHQAWPVYNWMGPCKAALRSLNQYVARDLGPRLIRANLVAAGPLITRAASGIPGFDQLLHTWATRAPIPWDPRDPRPVADAVCFLFSDLARAVTGEVIHVDGGVHAISASFIDELTSGS